MGKFLCLEGVDGAGKTTQLERYADWLRELGHDVVTCRDPGSTPLGSALRDILLKGALHPHRRAEMLLYMSARAQLVEELIRPALAAGKTVVADRFLLSNVVYQGHAGGLDIDEIWRIGRVATDGLTPDLTLILDLPKDSSGTRLDRERDRMESQGEEFRGRLGDGYRREANRFPETMVVVDASRSIDQVAMALREATRKRFGWAED